MYEYNVLLGLYGILYTTFVENVIHLGTVQWFVGIYLNNTKRKNSGVHGVVVT